MIWKDLLVPNFDIGYYSFSYSIFYSGNWLQWRMFMVFFTPSRHKLLPLPSESCPIHYSLITLPLDSTIVSAIESVVTKTAVCICTYINI